MTWQIPLFFNIIFATIRGFLDKKLSNRVDPFLALFYLVSISGLGYFLLYFVKYAKFPVVYPEMVSLGILYAFVTGFYMMAIRINLTQTVVFTSYYLAIPMLLSAIFLGEWRLFDPQSFSGLKTLGGVMLAFISMFLLLKNHNRKEERLEKKWFVFVLSTIILNGIAAFWGKTFINNHGALETMASQVIGGVPVLFLINLWRGKNFRLSQTNYLLAIVDGAVITFAVVFYYMAVRNGPLSIVLPVQSLALTAALVLVGLFIFKEAHEFNREKILGLILGGIGVGLLVI